MFVSKAPTPLTIREYITSGGVSPFRDWLDTLDAKVKARIQARVLRFETGNLGDHKSVGAGVWEARLVFGPGYRIYFGKDGKTVILLLAGGTKPSQKGDISQAQAYRREYLEAKRHGKTKQGLERGTREGLSRS
ncbi:MAG: type II toxin-antitoxin system RelE/ParE family toxin [Luteitalea sp.]|nr:type II toxin-antitoxin system RelE/ParE family toxin [Luteitalea sp.]